MISECGHNFWTTRFQRNPRIACEEWVLVVQPTYLSDFKNFEESVWRVSLLTVVIAQDGNGTAHLSQCLKSYILYIAMAYALRP